MVYYLFRSSQISAGIHLMKTTHVEHSQLFTPDNLIDPVSMETSGTVTIEFQKFSKIPLY